MVRVSTWALIPLVEVTGDRQITNVTDGSSEETLQFCSVLSVLMGVGGSPRWTWRKGSGVPEACTLVSTMR